MNKSERLTCDQLHQKAMDLANLAVKFEKSGQTSKAQKQFEEAYNFEKEAAMTLAYEFSTEPSRSILFRSAAFLALKAKKYEEAEKMAAFGLIGNPPSEIANELRVALDETLSFLKVAA